MTENIIWQEVNTALFSFFPFFFFWGGGYIVHSIKIKCVKQVFTFRLLNQKNFINGFIYFLGQVRALKSFKIIQEFDKQYFCCCHF